jgi:predicted RNA-binding Zn-ribbon protein involved in translation (DUF1610 family)
MRWENCDVCGDRRPAGEVSSHEDVHFGYCPHCGRCLGRFMKDPVTGIWDAIPPHCSVGNGYYYGSVWGSYYCPHCGRVKERLPVPRKAN